MNKAETYCASKAIKYVYYYEIEAGAIESAGATDERGG